MRRPSRKRSPAPPAASLTIVLVAPHASKTVWVMLGSRAQADWVAEALNEAFATQAYESDSQGNVCMERAVADAIRQWCEAPALRQIPLPVYLKASREGLKPPRRERRRARGTGRGPREQGRVLATPVSSRDGCPPVRLEGVLAAPADTKDEVAAFTAGAATARPTAAARLDPCDPGAGGLDSRPPDQAATERDEQVARALTTRLQREDAPRDEEGR